MQVKSKVWLEKNNELIFGTGKSALLKAIYENKSINKAAGALGISFRRAWAEITAIEKRMNVSLVKRTRGGRDLGGSVLTSAALGLMNKYDKLENSVREYADKEYKRLFKK